MNAELKKVTVNDFVESFGTTIDTFSSDLIKNIEAYDFSYRLISGKSRDAVILDVLKFTEKDNQVIAGPGRKDVWHKGWGENLKAFRQATSPDSAIVPKFIRAKMPIRFKQEFIMPADDNFELNYLSIFRDWFYCQYFKTVDNVYEFGAGTGFNLIALSKMFPSKNYFGSDFVQSSVDLIGELDNKYNIKLKSFIFDMLNPDINIHLKENSAIFTFGALEQLASQYENFLQYLLCEQPVLCLHVEPTVELYDESNLIDHLARSFHRKRGYSEGMLPRLQALEHQGKIELLKVKRLYFGSINFEGYTLIVWRPL